MCKQNSINLACWNIDGLFTRIGGQRFCKLNDQLFQTKTKNIDILCLVETHCGPNDLVSLDGYLNFQNFRPKTPGAPKHFGGISIFVKSELKSGVKILPITNSEIYWMKLCKNFFQLEHDLFVAAAYVCPSTSSYASKRDNI